MIRFLMGALNCILPTAKALVTEVGGSEHEMVGMSTTTGEDYAANSPDPTWFDTAF